MRKTNICPKCRHNRILLTKAVPLDRFRDLHIAATVKRTWMTQRPVRSSTGCVQAAICKACGFTELYTQDVASIPIDGRLVREVVGPEPDGPFR